MRLQISALALKPSLNGISAILLIAALFSSLPGTARATNERDYDFAWESGFLGVQNHRIMFSEDNTYFDYVEDGGQDTLFRYNRYTADIRREGDFVVRFVYQPIALNTASTLEEDLKVDNVVFDKGTPMEYRYSFPYYRGTYFWNVLNGDALKIYGGLGLQIRNATISFAKQDGTEAVHNRDVGPVPLFSLLVDYDVFPATTLHFEAEGNYANTAFINGDDSNSVTGAIIDTAISLEQRLNDRLSGFSTFRYLSGGAAGTSEERENPTSDGYTSNWIDVMAFSLGLRFHLDEWR